MTQASTGASSKFEVRPTASDHFAWLRTRLAMERTLLAWVRTGSSLIGFGFTIVQFFDRMQDLSYAKPARFPDAPRYLGLMLITCGVAALIVAAWQYRVEMEDLSSGDFAVIAGGEQRATPNSAHRDLRRAYPCRPVRVVRSLLSSFVTAEVQSKTD